ncbi:hypothetical protein VC83_07759 [Pseudogymnoascus destructans]|uniref:Zn(2)-C6 fungal-type domain-containing protein n=2 Tax=Pseudogymnoascus destructans TaxID=655981 RepID=L8FN25_PSED2|nr:uncharacterized protein VC83_07759 [Pseudogymnoascus destructans]ELR02370.1 hypothetical protein GMDG_05434 [Pseudogymnoascus destructans 20631-21]OAF55701.1 hypothetical protein VC83_07759 [Pseudogymnoascus destructans]
MTPPTTSPDSSPRSPSSHPPSPKRKADASNTTASNRPVKRRASKACQCCRARKVRCNVVEHGAPCTNCRLDEVPCIVTESRRRKKHPYHNLKPTAEESIGSPTMAVHTHTHMQHPHHHPFSTAEALANGSVNPIDISNGNGNFLGEDHSVSSVDQDDEMGNFHVPHGLYHNQMSNFDQSATPSVFSLEPPTFTNLVSGFASELAPPSFVPTNSLPPPPQHRPQSARQLTNGLLPAYIKPLNARISIEDVGHLWKKGALTLPDVPFRDALLSAYVEYVHPYMPLIELRDFLNIVDEGTGDSGRISLLLFQAVMFTGVAFVDMAYLTAAGYATRKGARKALYLKSRALYDFDYETDRVAIVQALLLMTYWYETPDDQKDTWHWMGVAISLAHTIGLHRNPSPTSMPPRKQKLWKRIWWSCFMRDRLVALGMRRPTRIKDEDFDVPMLDVEDFETEELPSHILSSCGALRNSVLLTDLAHLCIAKAKLCLCISHVLGAQYSVLIRDQGQAMGQEGNTRSSVMLFPKKLDQTDEVRDCDSELAEWLVSLPEPCLYRAPTPSDVDAGQASLVVQRALLHMCYHATLSALHRPQVLPSAETAAHPQCRALQDVSRRQVREASREITRAAQALFHLQLARYLPTTGVTVLLPAIIIHLLDIKSPNSGTRDEARRGFAMCMAVLELLRDNYAAADFATQFLGAAMRKAGIDSAESPLRGDAPSARAGLTPPPDSGASGAGAPPPQAGFWDGVNGTPNGMGVGEVTTPPDDNADAEVKLGNCVGAGEEGVFEEQFGALVDFGEGGPGADGAEMVGGMHGESGGFMMGGMEFGGSWGGVMVE